MKVVGIVILTQNMSIVLSNGIVLGCFGLLSHQFTKARFYLLSYLQTIKPRS